MLIAVKFFVDIKQIMPPKDLQFLWKTNQRNFLDNDMQAPSQKKNTNVEDALRVLRKKLTLPLIVYFFFI